MTKQPNTENLSPMEQQVTMLYRVAGAMAEEQVDPRQRDAEALSALLITTELVAERFFRDADDPATALGEVLHGVKSRVLERLASESEQIGNLVTAKAFKRARRAAERRRRVLATLRGADEE